MTKYIALNPKLNTWGVNFSIQFNSDGASLFYTKAKTDGSSYFCRLFVPRIKNLTEFLEPLLEQNSRENY